MRDESNVVFVELLNSQIGTTFNTQGHLGFPLDPNLPEVHFEEQPEILPRELSFVSEGHSLAESSQSSHVLDLTGQCVRVGFPGRGLKHPPALQRIPSQEQPAQDRDPSRSPPVIRPTRPL